MSAAHTSPTLSLTSQIELVKWDPGFTDFDEKINASFICFEPDLQAADIDTGRHRHRPDDLLSNTVRTPSSTRCQNRVGKES